MFSFLIATARAMIARGRAAAPVKGAYFKPQYGHPSRDREASCLWLIGDAGVDLTSNGRHAQPARQSIRYAMESDPRTNPDYSEYMRRYFGGDHRIGFHTADEFHPLLDAQPSPAVLPFDLGDPPPR